MDAGAEGGLTASAPSWSLRDLLAAAAVANHVIARRLGLGLTDLTALDHLLVAGPLGTGELAGRLGMRSPSATALLDRLEAAGYVRRAAHPGDRRRVLVEPTPAGRRAAERAVGPLVAELDALAAGRTAEERALVAEHLAAVAAVLREHGR
jgi:DNA-binding MarR family transcriptional regulator